MKNVIGKILSGKISGESATFKIVSVKYDDITGECYAMAECVEFGAPLQRIGIADIHKPVRA